MAVDVLERDGGFALIECGPGTRLDGAAVARNRPDVVLVDVEFVERVGLALVREIRQACPGLPIFVLSPASSRAAGVTFHALAAGATDHVAVPVEAAPGSEAVNRFAADLLSRMRAHRRVEPRPAPEAPTIALPQSVRRSTVKLVCIGASTGGPKSLAELFAGFVRPLPVPVSVVQHMPATFTAMLAHRLDALPGELRCREAREGDVFTPGLALLAPGGRHLGVARSAEGRLVARLNDGPPVNACRPAADVLFSEAVEAVGAGVLAVVMTGMGNDGLHGARRVREAGGQVIAQDEATSVVWGMPGTVSRAGLADAVVPLGQLAAEISRRVLTRPGA